MRKPALSAPELISWRLDSTLSPTEALRRWRDESGLVALMGDWSIGSALIAFDPVESLAPDGDPFEAINQARIPRSDDDPRFAGGWIGAWGYQLGSRIESLPPAPDRPVPMVDFHLSFYDWVLVLRDGTWWFEALVTPEREGMIEAACVRVAGRMDAAESAPRECVIGVFEMVPTAENHKLALAETLDHIAAGDIFQANICVRLEADYVGDPLDVFCQGVERLRPAYAAFLRTDDGAIASMSPELFLRRDGDALLTSPIKGTAPPGSDVDELVASAKDRAENIMIVDLMRNDLGRVSVPGSIDVPAIARVESHAVWHLVSDVVGTLRHGVTDAELLRATFPPGSVTGAPKVRAMEIINEFEATGRETYTGAIGYVSPCAGLELNVVIRTFEFKGGRVWLGVGGGIVSDSTPEDELAECLVKATPLISAVGASLDPDLAATVVMGPKPRTRSVEFHEQSADSKQGVFETLLVRDGEIIERAGHIARFASSMRELYGVEVSADLSVRLDQVAGPLQGRHRLRTVGLPSGDLRIDSSPLEINQVPWTLIPKTVPGGLGAHKWCERPPTGAADHDVLICDEVGEVLETGRANLFVVRDDGVYTPPLDGRILPGIARDRVVRILTDVGVPVFQRRISGVDLANAAEVFVTNSLRGVMPIVACEGVGDWPIGKTTRWLRDRLRDFWLHPHPAGDLASTTNLTLDAKSSAKGAKVLLIDNYDSFVYNLAQYFAELGAATEVIRNDAVSVQDLVARQRRGEFTHLVVSPGPGTPADAGISSEAIRRLGPLLPTLGVCLGHQCIGEAYGGTVKRAPQMVHGKPSLVHHDGRGIYAGIDSPLVAARYHSLVIDPSTLPDALVASAHTAAGDIMGVRHRHHRVEGVQVHPESILTAHGHELLSNFLHSVG